jgi:hypothetical protein
LCTAFQNLFNHIFIEALGEYLAWSEDFRKEAGPCLESELVSIDGEAT